VNQSGRTLFRIADRETNPAAVHPRRRGLERAIWHYPDTYQPTAKPLVGTKTADQILASGVDFVSEVDL
jgi:hypothetical protein